MNKITATRLNEMEQWGYMNNNANMAKVLKQIISNAESEYNCNDTYFTDKKETEIQLTAHTENQECTLRGMAINYPELVSYTSCLDLNHGNIKNIDKLVRTIYKKAA